MGFTGDTLGLGGRRSSFHQAGAGDGGGGGATTRAVGVACTWVINWKRAGGIKSTQGGVTRGLEEDTSGFRVY